MEYIKLIFDFIIHVDVHLKYLFAEYDTWVYAILFIIIFCETGLVVTPFLPGDSLLFVSGTLTALSSNNTNIHLMVLLLIFAAVSGDATNYAIGKYFGKKIFSNPHSKIFKQSYLAKTHAFYEKHGGKTIIIARFIPVIRTFAPFVAGMGHMNYRHFFSFNLFGGIGWVSLFMYAGYFFGGLDFVQNNMKLVVIVIIIVSSIPPVWEFLKGKKKDSKK